MDDLGTRFGEVARAEQAPARHRRPRIEGLDVVRMSVRPYGKWRLILTENIIHLHERGSEFLYCMMPVPRHAADVTRQTGEITCVMCCDNIIKPLFRVR